MKGLSAKVRTALLTILIVLTATISLSACNGAGGGTSVTGTFENVDGEILVFASDNSMRTIKGSDVAIGTFSTTKDDIELAYRGMAQKYGYSLKNKQLILYSLGTTNNISTGVVYEKTGETLQSAARSEATIENITGIYEDRAYALTGGVINKAYVFKDDGSYRYLENAKATTGTYTIDGSKLILQEGDIANVWYAEIRDGDLILFSASSAHSDGTYYSNVSEKYAPTEEKYLEAAELYKTGQFEDAMNAFLSIREYWDSEVQGEEAGYKAAVSLYEKQNYREALKILNKLGDGFDDYRSIFDECRRAVAQEDIEQISITTTSKRNSTQESSSYGGHVFEFSIDLTNNSPDEILELKGTMNIYNSAETGLLSVSIYNGDGVKPGMTRTMRFTADASRSAGADELYNTILENLTVRFVLDSVSFEDTTYTNINRESTLHEAASVVSMDSTTSSVAVETSTAADSTTVTNQIVLEAENGVTGQTSSYSGNNNAEDYTYSGSTGYPVNDNFTLYVVNCNESITLRNAPNLRATEIIQIPLGSAVTFIEAAENGFNLVNYQGNVGYALASYMSTEPPVGSNYSSKALQTYQTNQTLFVVNCNESITLRSAPSTSAQEIRQIPKGDPVTYVEDASNGFYKIIYLGNTGYALASYLSPNR